MQRRISILVATGFGALLALGVLASGIVMIGLRSTVEGSRAMHASGVAVRANVRDLRADYFESADAVARLLLDPARPDARAQQAAADAKALEHLSAASAATTREDLRALLMLLRDHDARTTDRLERAVMRLAARRPAKARAVYFRELIPARAVNLALARQALRMSGDEVAAAAALTEQQAAGTFALGWTILGVFGVAAVVCGALLSGAVRAIIVRFEEAAAEVTRQRDHLQAVMTAMRDALVVTDASGRVTTVNDAARELLGWDPGALAGRLVAELLEPDDGAVGAGTVRVRARSGETIPMAISAAALRDATGHETGAVWVARDMREPERMLRALAAARDAAVEGSRTKSEFLANMSHEVRTPLNVIIGYLDVALGASLPPTERDCLVRARGAAVGLLGILNDVLDLSRVEAGKLVVESVPFGVRGVVADAVDAFRPQAAEKGLDLSLEIAADVPDRVTGDPSRLRQVLLNLVGNAVKFTDAGGVAVRLSVRPGWPLPGPLVHVAVSDTGVGIPADKQRLLFQPFSQVDGSMTRRFGGTGLGLAIAARLVELMGGEIWVDSVPGEGSVFQFTLPGEAAGQASGVA